ncbi:MAG TPA: hypothetical protein VL225_05305 [Vicinamibacterales bacterium]|jgi:hypothetical protein|nr:hypothetical protein [Vicinamibacterales bacterium]
MKAVPLVIVLAVLIRQTAAMPASPPALTVDYAFFKARVQPIFLAKRPGHARCYVCHRGSGATSYLQVLSPGAATWNDEQSRKNFDAVRRYIVPGHPEQSRLLIHPLAEEAGGDDFHGGGRQFAARNTPGWQTIAAWIRGERLK